MANISTTVTLISSSTILLLILTHPTPGSCAPTHLVKRETMNTSDPQWRMVTGAKASSSYTFYQQVVSFQRGPLVFINGSSSLILQPVLKGVCDLLSFYELISAVDNSSDLYLLLTQNIVDSCTWLNYLVTEISNVTGSEEFLSIPEMCTPNYTPRLHQYCLQLKVREQDQLSHLVQRNIYDGLSTYYPALVTESHQCQWIQSSSAITDEVRDRIEPRANLYCTE